MASNEQREAPTEPGQWWEVTLRVYQRYATENNPERWHWDELLDKAPTEVEVQDALVAPADEVSERLEHARHVTLSENRWFTCGLCDDEDDGLSQNGWENTGMGEP